MRSRHRAAAAAGWTPSLRRCSRPRTVAGSIRSESATESWGAPWPAGGGEGGGGRRRRWRLGTAAESRRSVAQSSAPRCSPRVLGPPPRPRSLNAPPPPPRRINQPLWGQAPGWRAAGGKLWAPGSLVVRRLRLAFPFGGFPLIFFLLLLFLKKFLCPFLSFPLAAAAAAAF